MITFDAGGTIFVPDPPVGIAYSQTAASLGVNADPDVLARRFRKVFGRASSRTRDRVGPREEREFWRKVVEQTFGEYCPPTRIEALFDALYDAYSNGRYWRAVDGVHATLERLRSMSYRIALISNADARFRRVLADLDLDRFFDEIFISAEVGWEKPDIRLFRAVERQCGLSSHEILHVGDSFRHDGTGPREAGWYALVLGEDIDNLQDLLEPSS